MKVFIVLCAVAALTVAGPAGRKAESDSDDSLEKFLSAFFGSGEDSAPEDSDESESAMFSPSFGLFPMPRMPDFSSLFSGFSPISELFGMLTFFSDPTSDPNTKVVNATSHTEIVDGHKITVNETVYETGDGMIFYTKLINVGSDGETVPDKIIPEKSDELPKKNSNENEIEPVSPHQGDGSELKA